MMHPTTRRDLRRRAEPTQVIGSKAVLSRRALLGSSATAIAGLAAPFAVARPVAIKIGLMLPYDGEFSAISRDIADGLKLAVSENAGKLGGRDVEIVQLDDQNDVSKATDNARKLLLSDKVDVLVGTVSSPVAVAMSRVAVGENATLVVPNAGTTDLTGKLCAPNVFRTSFSNWQPGYAMGQVATQYGHKKAATITWKYPSGEQSVLGFQEGFGSGGGSIARSFLVPFPEIEFSSELAELAQLSPDCVYAFFVPGRGGAQRFVDAYTAAGLKDKIPLYGPGLLTDFGLGAIGPSAEGLLTTLHYVEDLPNAKNESFTAQFSRFTDRPANMYAVHGYDVGQLLAAGLNLTRGDSSAKDDLHAAMRGAKIASPRGDWTFSKSQNPIQDFYLRKVVRGQNRYQRLAVEALTEPMSDCPMSR